MECRISDGSLSSHLLFGTMIWTVTDGYSCMYSVLCAPVPGICFGEMYGSEEISISMLASAKWTSGQERLCGGRLKKENDKGAYVCFTTSGAKN